MTFVNNKEMGDVKFKAIRTDEDANVVLQSEVVFWTHQTNTIFNIVHMHLNDGSEDTTVDVEYASFVGVLDLRKCNFGTDKMGRKLRYKIMVKDMKIFAVLYNTGASIE